MHTPQLSTLSSDVFDIHSFLFLYSNKRPAWSELSQRYSYHCCGTHMYQISHIQAPSKWKKDTHTHSHSTSPVQGESNSPRECYMYPIWLALCYVYNRKPGDVCHGDTCSKKRDRVTIDIRKWVVHFLLWTIAWWWECCSFVTIELKRFL